MGPVGYLAVVLDPPTEPEDVVVVVISRPLLPLSIHCKPNDVQNSKTNNRTLNIVFLSGVS
jgi:hypothetical protein